MQGRVESALERHLPLAASIPARLHEAMRYATLGGGKRIRPLLVFAAGELTGAEPGALEVVACAVELIHAYSLVHDDLPCMDDDVLRRGRPTCHVEFDEPTAFNFFGIWDLGADEAMPGLFSDGFQTANTGRWSAAFP